MLGKTAITLLWGFNHKIWFGDLRPSIWFWNRLTVRWSYARWSLRWSTVFSSRLFVSCFVVCPGLLSCVFVRYPSRFYPFWSPVRSCVRVWCPFCVLSRTCPMVSAFHLRRVACGLSLTHKGTLATNLPVHGYGKSCSVIRIQRLVCV